MSDDEQLINEIDKWYFSGHPSRRYLPEMQWKRLILLARAGLQASQDTERLKCPNGNPPHEPPCEFDDGLLPEVPCCPVHERLYRAGKTVPLDNCFVCIRNERDELRERIRGLLAHVGEFTEYRDAAEEYILRLQQSLYGRNVRVRDTAEDAIDRQDLAGKLEACRKALTRPVIDAARKETL